MKNLPRSGETGIILKADYMSTLAIKITGLLFDEPNSILDSGNFLGNEIISRGILWIG